MKNQGLILLLMILSGSLFAQLATHEIRLPVCKGITIPKVHLVEDGFYREFDPQDTLLQQVRFTYSLEDGDRVGPLKIYSENGELKGEGYFEKNRLRDGVLHLYEERDTLQVELIYDAPTWFLQENWRQASGSQQTIDGKSYIWLACQRYRLPEGRAQLDLK